MIKVLFKTFNEGHLVSDKEFSKLKASFNKQEMELYRKETEGEFDIVMVKGFSHTWQDVKDYNKPIIYYSIGTEWKKNIDIKKDNEPLKELYFNSNAVIHISNYCKKITEKVFGGRDNVYVIIPANEPRLPEKYPDNSIIRLVSTAIWRPIKRVEEMKRVVELLKQEKNLPPIELIINGSPEGPMIDDLSLYHNCHIYLQLSRKEGMPNTVLEALSYGLPCLVTNHGGTKEAVGKAGYVIDNDPDDDVMLNLENIEPIDYEKFKIGFYNILENLDWYRAKVRQRVEEELNDEITAQQFKKVFKTLL